MAIIHVIALILIYDSSKGPSTTDLLDTSTTDNPGAEAWTLV
jgi:hypothetical protein